MPSKEDREKLRKISKYIRFFLINSVVLTYWYATNPNNYSTISEYIEITNRVLPADIYEMVFSLIVFMIGFQAIFLPLEKSKKNKPLFVSSAETKYISDIFLVFIFGGLIFATVLLPLFGSIFREGDADTFVESVAVYTSSTILMYSLIQALEIQFSCTSKKMYLITTALLMLFGAAAYFYVGDIDLRTLTYALILYFVPIIAKKLNET